MIMAVNSYPVALGSEIPEQARDWRNDRAVNRWCRQDGLISVAAHQRWLSNIETDSSIRMFSVLRESAAAATPEHTIGSSTFTPIGVCGFTSISERNRSAEFSLYIGPEYQGKGYGKAALRLLAGHGFNDLGFHRIWGEVFDGNPAMETFIKVGFRFEGTLRKTYWKDGRFLNSHMISMLAGELE